MDPALALRLFGRFMTSGGCVSLRFRASDRYLVLAGLGKGVKIKRCVRHKPRLNTDDLFYDLAVAIQDGQALILVLCLGSDVKQGKFHAEFT